MIRVALIGFGAIGRALAAVLGEHRSQASVVAALVRSGRGSADGPVRVAGLDELLALRPDVVVECAGHGALRDLGARVLDAGHDLLVASVGALADSEVEAALRRAAARGSAQVLLPSGALGALDILAAAKFAGLTRVAYRSIKPPAAWKGTPAQAAVDLAALRAPAVVFAGNAREAALRFPQNANVAAAVALAGAGFEATHVELLADPAATGNSHRIEAEGAFGKFEFAVAGRVLPDNPKTSMLVPHSLARSVLNRRAAIALA
ncbi:MAG: aspartate dehydrogenase [Burkholderiales bacterium]|nr:aspartate dehydrogenase [Burkholderiales bacterium]